MFFLVFFIVKIMEYRDNYLFQKLQFRLVLCFLGINYLIVRPLKEKV